MFDTDEIVASGSLPVSYISRVHFPAVATIQCENAEGISNVRVRFDYEGDAEAFCEKMNKVERDSSNTPTTYNIVGMNEPGDLFEYILGFNDTPARIVQNEDVRVVALASGSNYTFSTKML